MTVSAKQVKPIRIRNIQLDLPNKCVRIHIRRTGWWGTDEDDTVVHYWHGAGFAAAIQDALNWAIKEAQDIS